MNLRQNLLSYNKWNISGTKYILHYNHSYTLIEQKRFKYACTTILIDKNSKSICCQWLIEQTVIQYKTAAVEISSLLTKLLNQNGLF